MLMHMANISYRIGQQTPLDLIEKTFSAPTPMPTTPWSA